MLINAGVREIFFVEGYPDELARSFCEEAGVRLVRMDLP